MALRIWISLVSKLVRRIVRQYGAACVGTIIAIGIYHSFLQSHATAGARPLFCVLVPHFKDEYWLSVGFGLEQEAELQNVGLMFFEAGGYGARVAQIDQLDACLAQGVDAILIGAVTSDHPDLTDAIARVAQEIPIFGLINELHAEALSGRIGVDWQGMGQAVGRHLSLLHPAGSPPKTAVFLTGPSEAGWTGPLEIGLRRELAGSAVTILEVLRADTGLRQQLALTEIALERYPDADYLIGSAPAVEAAVGLLATRPDAIKPQLLATYVSHTIKRGLMNGSVLAASFDDPMLQARMAIRQAALAASTPVKPAGPEIVLLTSRHDNLGNIRMSPADYFPTIQ
jgi:protein TorT